jgi:SAM-dependent methyltransferase
VEHYEQIPGWFDYQDLYDRQVACARDGAVFVEIGAYLGRSTAYLATRILRSGKSVRVYVVDLWDGFFRQDAHRSLPMNEGEDVFWHFMRNMRAAGLDAVLCPLKMDSVRAAGLFEEGSVDFVFVDGDHGREPLRCDLEAWFPRVRPGGVLAGHDYVNDDFPGVRQAADEFFAARGLPLEVCGTSFVVRKPRPHWIHRAARASRRLLTVSWR